MQTAAGLGRDAVYHAEAEPTALADLLGREEGLDRASEDLLGHAFAGIGDRDQHIIARRQIRRRLAAADIGGADRQPAASGHRVAGVDRQVQQHQLDLRRVDQRGPQPLGQHGLDAHGRPDRAEQHVARFTDQPIEIERPRREALLARKSEQLVR